MNTIKNMPNTARVWVYQSNRFFTENEIKEIMFAGENFINQWSAHGAMLTASFDVFHNLFIVLSVDENQALASGCSIDKSVHFMKEIENKLAINLFNRLLVAYRKGDEVMTCNVNQLAEQVTKHFGEGRGEVIVFNNMVTTKAAFDVEWEQKLKNSWMKRELV